MTALLQTNFTFESALSAIRAWMVRARHSRRVKDGWTEFRAQWQVALLVMLVIFGLISWQGLGQNPWIPLIAIAELAGFMVWLGRRFFITQLQHIIGRLFALLRVPAVKPPVTLTPGLDSPSHSVDLEEATPPPRTDLFNSKRRYVSTILNTYLARELSLRG